MPETDISSRVSFMEATLKGLVDKVDSVKSTLDQLLKNSTDLAVLQERTSHLISNVELAHNRVSRVSDDLSAHLQSDLGKFDDIRKDISTVDNALRKYVHIMVGVSLTLSALASATLIWSKIIP